MKDWEQYEDQSDDPNKYVDEISQSKRDSDNLLDPNQKDLFDN